MMIKSIARKEVISSRQQQQQQLVVDEVNWLRKNEIKSIDSIGMNNDKNKIKFKTSHLIISSLVVVVIVQFDSLILSTNAYSTQSLTSDSLNNLNNLQLDNNNNNNNNKRQQHEESRSSPLTDISSTNNNNDNVDNDDEAGAVLEAAIRHDDNDQDNIGFLKQAIRRAVGGISGANNNNNHHHLARNYLGRDIGSFMMDSALMTSGHKSIRNAPVSMRLPPRFGKRNYQQQQQQQDSGASALNVGELVPDYLPILEGALANPFGDNGLSEQDQLAIMKYYFYKPEPHQQHQTLYYKQSRP